MGCGTSQLPHAKLPSDLRGLEEDFEKHTTKELEDFEVVTFANKNASLKAKSWLTKKEKKDFYLYQNDFDRKKITLNFTD